MLQPIEKFKSRKVEKRYVALVEGKIDEPQGRIVAPIGRDPRDRKRMAVILADKVGSATARPATTEYEVLARYAVPLQNDLGRGLFTLVQAHPSRVAPIKFEFTLPGSAIRLSLTPFTVSSANDCRRHASFCTLGGSA